MARHAPRAPALDGAALFASLPEAVLLQIWALLPADARGRAATVCRLWRDALASPAAWLSLDVSAASGVAVALRGEALLRGASALALCGLNTLDASGVHLAFVVPGPQPAFTTLLELVTANASLRTLRNPSFPSLSVEELGALLTAAPALTALHAHVLDSVAGLTPLLRRELPNSAALRLEGVGVRPVRDDAEVLALAAALAAHGGCRRLHLHGYLDFSLGGAAANALVNSVVAGIEALCFHDCRLSEDCVPSLNRLLREGSALRELEIDNINEMPLLDDWGHAVAVLAAALRDNASLTRLSLDAVFLHAADAATLLTALVAHRSLRELSLLHIVVADTMPPAPIRRMRAALHALVVANATVLQTLNFGYQDEVAGEEEAPFEQELRDTVAAALPQNTHLTSVECCGLMLREP